MISSSLLTPRHLLVVVLLLAGFAGHALFVSFWAGFYGNKKADHDDVGQHSKRSKRGQAKHRGFLFFSRSVVLVPTGRHHSRRGCWLGGRSEERRVGKECRSRWARDD